MGVANVTGRPHPVVPDRQQQLADRCQRRDGGPDPGGGHGQRRWPSALVLLFLTDPVAELPTAVLGAVIVYAALGLVSVDEWRAIRAASRADFVIGVVAMLGVVVFGVLEGILVAVGLSIVHVVRRSARPHDAVLGWVPRLDRYADVKLHTSAQQVPGVVVYRLDDRLFFANADYVQGRVQEALAGSPTVVRSFVFDAEGLVAVDSTGVAAVEAVLDDFDRQGIGFFVARVKHPVREQLDRSGLSARIGTDHFFATVRAGSRGGRTRRAVRRRARSRGGGRRWPQLTWRSWRWPSSATPSSRAGSGARSSPAWCSGG